jgi:hypothetical protein
LSGIADDHCVPRNIDSGPASGQIIADPANRRWLKYVHGAPFFMCGPGDSEDFLYRGRRNFDGTRTGDQMSLIQKMQGTGANSIYLQAVRSHGGDCPADHNPFVNSNPALGLDRRILGQWENWFSAMEAGGIVIYFFFYDDGARIWITGDLVGPEERLFIHSIVNRFRHHKLLVWVVAEEYEEAYGPARVRNIAAAIRADDERHHVIAVHKRHGLSFAEFADDRNIGQFAIEYNATSPVALHKDMVTAWNNAAARYNLNMSEAANYGTGTTARKKRWAVAMGGAYVMILGMNIAATFDFRSRGLWTLGQIHGGDKLRQDGAARRVELRGHGICTGSTRRQLCRIYLKPIREYWSKTDASRGL